MICKKNLSVVVLLFVVINSTAYASFNFDSYESVLKNDSVYDLQFTKSNEDDYLFMSYEQIGDSVKKVYYKYSYNIKENAAISGSLITGGTGGADVNMHFYKRTGSTGSAILNRASTHVVGDMIGDFVENKGSSGGVIFNFGIIGNIKGDFIGNKSSGNGGAIYVNSISAKIGNVVGDFIGNEAVTMGGAIYNDKGEIGDINGSFVGNKLGSFAGTYGGAISNRNKAAIGIITGDFIGNNSGYLGGAIYNIDTASIGDIVGDFIANTAGYMGGAIYNSCANYSATVVDEYAKIGNITGDFIGNIAETFGGAIYNNRALVGNIDGDFIQNISESYHGGAIYNTDKAIMGNITGGFFENEAKEVGGAIRNDSSQIGYIVGHFIGNRAGSEGGAISNTSGTITSVTGDFILNSSGGNGGAIGSYESTIGYISGNLIENSAVNYGGAVYNRVSYGSDKVLNFVNSNFIDNSSGSNGGAIYSSGDLRIAADAGDSLIQGNTANNQSNAIYMARRRQGINEKHSTLTFEALNGGMITINDDIDGDKGYKMLLAGDGTGVININGHIKNAEIIGDGNAGLLGRAGSGANTIVNVAHADNINNSNTLLLTSGVFNIIDLGSTNLHFEKVTLNGGTLNVMNVTVDLAGLSMGTITADDYQSGVSAINVANVNVLTDGEERNVIAFTHSIIADSVVSGVNQAFGPVYGYDVIFDAVAGDFVFTRMSNMVNPEVQIPAVAAVAAVSVLSEQVYSKVLDDADGLFVANIDNCSQGEVRPFVKMFGSDENIGLEHFESTDSTYYGVIGGFESGCVNNTKEWNVVYNAYAAYVHGKHEFYFDDIRQDAGYVGVGANFYKGDFFTGFTTNVGIIHNEGKNIYGSDSFESYVAGVGVKTGYNYRLNNDYIIQPNIYGSYTYINAENYTTRQGAKVRFGDLHNVELSPGIKVIKSFGNEFKGYVQGRYVWVYNEDQKSTANNIELPNVEMKNYAEYGLGLERVWRESGISAFAEINRRDGGREGWSGMLGMKWMF